MRSRIGATLALAATAAVAHTHGGDRRKSLSFGPHHPRSKFETGPVSIATLVPHPDPLEFARIYVSHLTGQQHSFVVRSDSYTDDATGVSHVYVRQLVNGVEVADGNINLNIKDGKVLSYGDSFYRGDAPPQGVDPAADKEPHSQATYCAHLEQELESRNAQLTTLASFNGQVILGGDELETYVREMVEPVAHLWNSNCGSLAALASHHRKGEFVEPKKAALMFMIAAHPDPGYSDYLLANFDSELERITSTFDSHIVGTHETPREHLHNVPGTVNPVAARLVYVQTPTADGKTELNLVWKLEVEMNDNWYEAHVSVSDPTRIVSVVDWASDYAPIPKKDVLPTYNVWKWGINDPASGERSIETAPYDKLASPIGWHSLPAGKDPLSYNKRYADPHMVLNYTTTWGNNVFAHEDWEGRNNWIHNYRPDAGESMDFDYKYTLQRKNGSYYDPRSYINLTITQLFYTTNMVHDLYYRYGFDEKSGNFQQYNFGKGGEDGDAVIANAQDGSGYNNANFMTPPDGQNGRMRMYTWNVHGTPYRDGDLEAGIVIHELSHGLSTRLTGGPKDSSCLGWGESGGMGEGWGDFLATTIRSNANYSDYSMGAWAANETRGIRNYVYSTNMTVNPSTYKTLDKPGYWGVHAIGEVWAEILYVVSQALIGEHGYSETLFPPQPEEDGTIPEGNFYRKAEYTWDGKRKPLVPIHGNTLMVQLVLNGMKLQPCRPSFFEARDAIINADQILTGGENLCTLWKAFASRGLGPKASVEGRTPWGGGIRKDDFSLPKTCHVEEPEPEEPEPEEPEPEEPAPEEPGEGGGRKKHRKQPKHDCA